VVKVVLNRSKPETEAFASSQPANARFTFERDLSEIFRNTIQPWLEAQGEDRFIFESLEQDGQIYCGQLDIADISHRILFREEKVHEDIMQRFDLSTLATSLGRSWENKRHENLRYKNPIIMVQNPDGDFMVVQGNHRTYAALERNPERHPVFAVVFKSLEAYEKYSGMEVRPWSDGTWGTNSPTLLKMGKSQAA